MNIQYYKLRLLGQPFRCGGGGAGGGGAGDSGDGGTGAASSATGDAPGAGASGTGNGTDGGGDPGSVGVGEVGAASPGAGGTPAGPGDPGISDSSGGGLTASEQASLDAQAAADAAASAAADAAAAAAADAAASAAAQAQAQEGLAQAIASLGISATEASMMGMSNATGSNVATNGMTQAELGVMSSLGLGNMDISSTQTVDQALASMNVHASLNENIGSLMGVIGGPAIGAVATAANAIAQGHSPASVIGQVAASIVGTAISNATGINVNANTISAIASGQIGQAALGIAIGQVSQSTGLSIGTVTAALSGNLGMAVANTVTGAVIGQAAQAFGQNPGMVATIGQMTGMTQSAATAMASAINSNAVVADINSAVGGLTSSVASIGVPGGIGNVGAAINGEISGIDTSPATNEAAINDQQGSLLISALENNPAAITAANNQPVPPKAKKDYWGNLFSDLSVFQSPPKQTPTQQTSQPLSEYDAKRLATQVLGREPTEFELLELIGLPESFAKPILEGIHYDESYFDQSELIESYKAVYGKEPTNEWLASDEAMDMLERSEAQGKNLLNEFYTQDKNETTKDEAIQFWKAAGFTDDPTPEQLNFLMGVNEATAETYAIRTNDIYETTFDGSGYDSKASAQRAATSAGYNTYTWDGVDYSIPTTAETKAIQERRHELTEGILKQQGTTVAKATDEQLMAALAKVDAVPTSYLKSATIQDVIKGTYSVVDADGKLRVEVSGANIVADSPASLVEKAKDQLPKGMTLASDAEVWGVGGERNPNVEYMVLPDGTTAYVKRDAVTELPEQFIVAKRLDDLEVNDPEAWLGLAAQFDKKQDGDLGTYLSGTANALMLGAYATGNEKFGDIVKQTLSITTQGVGEQVENLSTFFSDRLGMDHDTALAKAGAALQEWGAANQSKSTKDQEAAIINAVSEAKGVGDKIGAFVVAAKDNPGGLMTMIAKEGVQEILPLWAAKAAYRLGTLAAVSANTAVETMESWGAGTKETYEEAKRMGFSDDDARTMASKVGLQSAVITTFTNGFGDNPLVKRIIGDTVKDSAAGIARAGGREAFTEYFDGLGSNAVQQYQLTGQVNWGQATTAATIGAGIGAGTSSGIMLGIAINSNSIVGRGIDGSNVTYADFLSGAKQVDMNTVSLNTQVGTDADGDAITLGNIVAMPVAAGLSYDVVKAGLPASITNTDVVLGTDSLGNTVTLSSLMSGVTESQGFDTAYKNLLNITPEQRTEAKYDFVSNLFESMGYTPTAQEVNNLVAQNPAVSQIDKAEVAQYVDPLVVTEQEAKDAYAALGLNKPTEADILKIVGQYDQNDLTGKASENLDAARYNSLLQQIEQLGAQAGVDPAVLDAIKNDINSQITALGGDVSKLQSGVDSVVSEQAKTQAQITDLQNNLSEEIQAAKDIGLEGDAALQAGLDSLSEKMGVDQAALLTQLGTTAADLKTQFASDIATSQEATAAEIADTKTALETQMKEQYDALTTEQKALADALTDQGTTLADAIAAAQESTATQISDLEAATNAQYEALTVEQKALADALTAQGTTLTDAIAAAQEQTQTQIGELATDVKTKFDALTEEQKALATSLQQQGVDLNTAIETAQQQTQQQISDLGVEVDARINELMQQGQTYQQATQTAFAEVNAKNQEMAGLIGTQGRTASQQDIDALSQMLSGQREVDLNYDVTGDKQITQADIDFLTQVIGGVKTDWTAPQESPWAATGLYGQIQANELRRQQDLAAADAQRVADQQAAAERARQESVRGGIRTTALQGQQQLQALQQQLPQAVQMSQTTSTPIYGEMGPYLDLGSPLDFDFFKPSPEKQAATKQAQPTKIAAGGYIDDLLAEGMSVDDLMNLLR